MPHHLLTNCITIHKRKDVIILMEHHHHSGNFDNGDLAVASGVGVAVGAVVAYAGMSYVHKKAAEEFDREAEQALLKAKAERKARRNID